MQEVKVFDISLEEMCNLRDCDVASEWNEVVQCQQIACSEQQ
jgi:hypothetical protein